MTSFIAYLSNESGKLRISVDIEAPTTELARKAAYLFAEHEPGKLHVVDLHDRPHVLKVDVDGNVQVARYLDDWEPYPDDRVLVPVATPDGALTKGRVWDVWRRRHSEEWDACGMRQSATDYAEIVAEKRVGERKSLSWMWDLSGGGRDDIVNRRLIRQQVDAVIEELRGVVED